jgi:hypothetical protein
MMSLSVLYVWSHVTPVDCVAQGTTDMSMDELVSVTRRLRAHGKEPSEDLTLTGKEATFLLNDNLRLPLRVDTRGEEVIVRVQVKEKAKCYDIEFQGEVEVDDGVAVVVPSRLVLGSLDVSAFTKGYRISIGSWLNRNSRASELLQKTDKLTVENDQFQVRIEGVQELR